MVYFPLFMMAKTHNLPLNLILFRISDSYTVVRICCWRGDSWFLIFYSTDVRDPQCDYNGYCHHSYAPLSRKICWDPQFHHYRVRHPPRFLSFFLLSEADFILGRMSVPG